MPTPNLQNRVIVLGAGAVGVSAALMLQQRGREVILIDRKTPASEASYGNAGLFAESSALTLNNPLLRRNLPKLLIGGSTTALRWDWSYLLANLPLFARFLAHSTPTTTEKRARALLPLILRGKTLHTDWLTACNRSDDIRPSGWLKCYRTEKQFDKDAYERKVWDTLGVAYTVPDNIAELAPTVRPVFARAVFLQNTLSVAEPHEAVRAYADRFVASGGSLQQAEITRLQQQNSHWQVSLNKGEQHTAANVVVALGAWSKPFLQQVGIRLPMFWEHGMYRQFTQTTPLPCPLYDVEVGYVVGMRRQLLRVTSGVYLSGQLPPRQPQQLNAAEHYLRQTVEGVGKASGEDWFGSRPTLSDCLPAVGQSKQQGLWLATGGHHIGLMTAPAVGELIANLLNAETPYLSPETAQAFSPARFGI